MAAPALAVVPDDAAGQSSDPRQGAPPLEHAEVSTRWQCYPVRREELPHVDGNERRRPRLEECRHIARYPGSSHKALESRDTSRPHRGRGRRQRNGRLVLGNPVAHPLRQMVRALLYYIYSYMTIK